MYETPTYTMCCAPCRIVIEIYHLNYFPLHTYCRAMQFYDRIRELVEDVRNTTMCSTPYCMVIEIYQLNYFPLHPAGPCNFMIVLLESWKMYETPTYTMCCTPYCIVIEIYQFNYFPLHTAGPCNFMIVLESWKMYETPTYTMCCTLYCIVIEIYHLFSTSYCRAMQSLGRLYPDTREPLKQTMAY